MDSRVILFASLEKGIWFKVTERVSGSGLVVAGAVGEE